MSPVLEVWVPLLPPSSNKIYIKHPTGKGRMLSPMARQFKVKTMKIIQKECRVAFMNLEHNVPYELRVVVFFEQVINKSYPKKSRNRYTVIDVSNRLKLIEDVVAEALDLDDPHNFRIVMEKHCDPETPGLYAILTRVPETEVGLTKEEYDKRHGKLPVRNHERDGTRSPMSPERFLGRASRHRAGRAGRSSGRKSPD